MKTLNVPLGDRSYPIFIGNALFAATGALDAYIPGDEVLVVTNETVAPLYLDGLLSSLTRSKVDSLILPDGEKYKTLGTVELIYNELLAKRHSRETTLIALGGGVVGDMTGFAAATYQRGVNFLQVPTTLLSQVDSSVGGKTGVNHPLGKNMVGAFYQPLAVFADMATLATLPDREYRAGVAEVVKYGLIGDLEFYQWIIENTESINARSEAALEEMVYRSCQNKGDVVARDERESNVRATLNLGHTFGHAIEAVEGYRGLLHGEAVAVGMFMAAEMSRRLGWLTSDEVSALGRLLESLGLPTSVPAAMTPENFLNAMALDKKVSKGTVRLVLLKSVGQAVITGDYPEEILRETISVFCNQAVVF